MSLPAQTRRLALRAMGASFLAAAAFCPAAVMAADAKPDVALFLARLDVTAGTVSEVRNVTPEKGANFQPAFTRDGKAVLFVSDRLGANNVYRHDVASGETTAVTDTKDKLYSPTPLADGSGFSAIRVVNADPSYGVEMKEPAVWRYGWDGKPVAPAIPTLRVGYHAWIDDQRLALFLVDEVPERNAHKAVLFNRTTGKTTLLTDKPGRSLGRTPDGKRATFVDQTDPAHWQICTMGEGDAKPRVLVETPLGPEGEKDPNRSQYFVWLPDGSMLMARGDLLLRWDGKAGNVFKPFTELPGLGGAIRNIAVSPDGTRLAFSVLLAAPKP